MKNFDNNLLIYKDGNEEIVVDTIFKDENM